jgi:hypothetical protein
MNDTTLAVGAEYRRLLMEKSSAERLTMATRAFDAARDFVLASFPPGLSAEQIRQRLFARMYGDMRRESMPTALRAG